MNGNAGCPFCNPDILDYSFLDGEKFLAVYNIAPILPGHSLIIPRKHITSIMVLTDDELSEFIRFSRKAIRILMHAFQTEAFNWTLQEKEEAGQTIAHLHIHIVPRKSKDLNEPGDWYPKLKTNIDDILDSQKRPGHTRAELLAIIKRLRNIATENLY